MLGLYLEEHEVDFEVTFVDGDPTWEVVIGGQDEDESVGGALKLPVVVLGKDVWWGETKVRERPPHSPRAYQACCSKAARKLKNFDGDHNLHRRRSWRLF
jgi:hypothetical protein